MEAREVDTREGASEHREVERCAVVGDEELHPIERLGEPGQVLPANVGADAGSVRHADARDRVALEGEPRRLDVEEQRARGELAAETPCLARREIRRRAIGVEPLEDQLAPGARWVFASERLPVGEPAAPEIAFLLRADPRNVQEGVAEHYRSS